MFLNSLIIFTVLVLHLKLETNAKYCSHTANIFCFLCRYEITPACDINFGPLVYGSKKSQTLTIENKGVFEFSFDLAAQAKPGWDSTQRYHEAQTQ